MHSGWVFRAIAIIASAADRAQSTVMSEKLVSDSDQINQILVSVVRLFVSMHRLTLVFLEGINHDEA